MRRFLFILIGAAMLTAPVAQASNTSNPGWLLDPVNQNWWCTSNVPATYCKADSPEKLAFAQVFPGDVAWNNRAVFLVNEWGGTGVPDASGGPGSEHFGDSALMFSVAATSSGLRGGDVAYRGTINPGNGHHWSASTSVIHAPDGTWFTVLTESEICKKETTDPNCVEYTGQKFPEPIPDNYTYLLRGQFYDWLYPNSDGLDPGEFDREDYVEVIWKNDTEDNRFRAKLRLFQSTASHPVYHGFAIYNAKDADGKNIAIDEAVPVTINIDAGTWYLTINGQNYHYNFGDDFPTCPLPGLSSCQGVLDGMSALMDFGGFTYTTRGYYHPFIDTVVPPDCPDLAVFESNLDQDPFTGGDQRRYFVHPGNGNQLLRHDEFFTVNTSGGEGAHTEVSGTDYDRPSFLNSFNSSALASYPAGDFYYRSNSDRVACRTALTRHYWSGAGIQVMDFQP